MYSKIHVERALLIFFLLIALGTANCAQNEPRISVIGMISADEKQAQLKLMAPHTPLIVNNYDLKYHRFNWFIDPAKIYISGSVTSYFVATQPSISTIQFELNSGMSVDSAFHKNKIYNINHSGSVVTIPLNGILAPGILDSVTVYYHGKPADSFYSRKHSGTYAMFTSSEPYGASNWWPSKNDLTDKIDSTDIYVVTPQGNHVASNGLLISETPYGANSIQAHWKHRYPITPYLIAVAATNYDRFSDYYVVGNDSLEILNYVYPEDFASIRINAADIVLQCLALFEELFTPYPFWSEKYGHTQWEGGAMENQTMTFLNKKGFNFQYISHELAHQWFGDMITCGSWQDVWLNEGFATYCEGLTYENLFERDYWSIWKRDIISSVTSDPGGSVYCTDTIDWDRTFDLRLSYNKGAMLLHMLRWVIGDEDFFAGIKNYLNDPKLRYGFARTADFKSHMEAASNRNLKGFFDDWFAGQGYPTYTIDVGQQPDHTAKVTIYQSQSHSSVSFFKLPVPLQFFSGGRDTIIVFNHTFSGQVFTINFDFAIDLVKFDPEQWIVSLNNKSVLRMEDLPVGNNLVLLPNPASNFLYIHHNLGKINSLVVLSLDGKPLSLPIKMPDDTRIEMDIRNTKPGLYLLQIEYNSRIVTRKFVVSR